LDPQTRRHIWQYIRNMNKKKSVTVILTTHYMEEADYLCDRVAIIDKGKIVALDTPENLKDMIGSDTISLEVQSGEETLLQSLQSFPWIKSAAYSNGNIEIMVDHAQSRIPEVMQEACRNNAVIKTVSLHQPTLEDAFLKFTGKKIRASSGVGNGMGAMMFRRIR
jgi:ABC-2 type transport system ATP-binding protein